MPDAAGAARDLAWEGCYNARDLGGLPVVGGGCIRRGALVRSDNLSRLTPAGVAALGAFGVRTVLDVRSRSELSLEPHPFLGHTGRGDVPRYVHLPLLDEDDPSLGDVIARVNRMPTGAESYLLMVDGCRAQVGRFVRAFAEAPAGGVVVHCHSGTDRAGVLVALLLAAAGVPDDAIAEDYARSEARLRPLYERQVAAMSDPVRRAAWKPVVSPPAFVLGVLDELRRRHGEIDGFLGACGVDVALARRVRGRLVE